MTSIIVINLMISAYMSNSYLKVIHLFGCHSIHFSMLNLLYRNKTITVQRDILFTNEHVQIISFKY